jgi:hypothetical protein
MRTRVVLARKLTALTVVLLILLASAASTADRSVASTNEIPTITAFTMGLTRIAGFLTLFREDGNGALYLEIPASGTADLLYQASLGSGFGQRLVTADGTPSGTSLDRGYLGSSRLVTFRPIGGKVLLVERNTNYFTPSAAYGSVDDTGYSFPDSVVAAFEIKAREGDALLLDATSFFKRDDIGIADALRASGQGSFTLDDKLSSVDSFSANGSDLGLDVEAILTFATTDAKPENDLLSNVAANRNAVLVREHHSFYKLANFGDTSYRPRIFDQRAGYFDNTFYDPSRLPTESLRRSYVARHLLTKKDPGAETSEPEHPILFYIDSSVPIELHSAVKEAVFWWNSAFEVAGFQNALQVEKLPKDINPLSVGVNVIIWVPRTTRGWSYGAAVADPRSGQILKAIVRLDGMRLRADRLLFDALTAPYTDKPDFTHREKALLQRFKLLVAHEIGHALGLRHQYIGSAQGNSSVMDYPFPNITLDADGVPRLHDVFPTAVGPWDKFMIQYGYQPFSSADEPIELRKLIDDAKSQGYYWMTDDDAADADPFVEKWDFGADPVAHLNTVLSIRKAALTRFSRAVISANEPLALVQDAIVPIYLLHQFAVKAVAAMIGGYTYQHSMRDQAGPKPIPVEQQRQALRALLLTLDPSTLNLAGDTLKLMNPRPPSYAASNESFKGSTGMIFDGVRPIEVAASITMQEILKPSRAARLAEASKRDRDALGLREVLNSIVDYTWKGERQESDFGVAQRAVALVVVQSLLAAIGSKQSTSAVRGVCWLVLDDLQKWMDTHRPNADWEEAYAFASHSIKQDPSKFPPSPFSQPILDPM